MIVEREQADEFRRRIAERNATPPTERTNSPLAWFKAHVSEIDLGEHFAGEPRPKHCNKNEKVLKHFAALERGEQSFLSHQWNWDKITAHCHGFRKLYWAGAGESKKPLTLILIDVDCKTKARPKGHGDIFSFSVITTSPTSTARRPRMAGEATATFCSKKATSTQTI